MRVRTIAVAALGGLAALSLNRAGAMAQQGPEGAGRPDRPRVEPYRVPASAGHPEVVKGVQWLLRAQNADGGWGENPGQPSRCGNTALSALVLARAGVLAKDNTARKAAERAVAFLHAQIARAIEDRAPRLESRGRTQLQNKLGAYADTFMTAIAFAELGRHLPDGKAKRDAQWDGEALVAMVERSQTPHGGWSGGSWAPILQQSFGAMALAHAQANGIPINPQKLQAVRHYMARRFDTTQQSFAPAQREGAGIELYAAAAVLGSMRGVVRASGPNATPLQQLAVSVDAAATKRLGDARFLQGFGSLGGEEMFSYWTVSDSLRDVGSKAWPEWDRSIRARLRTLQNGDGSWAGHHCITGRVPTSCGALMTLLYEPADARKAH